MEKLEYINHLAQHIGSRFPARYTSKQKQAFRTFLLQELTDLGWEADVVSGGFLLKSRNVVTKNPHADVLLLAHYDTIGYDFVGGLLSRLVGSSLAGQLFGGVILGLLLFRLAGWVHMGVVALLPPPILWLLEIALPLFIFAPMFVPNKHCMNDNTSGVITLLNLARQLNACPHLKERVQLAFVDLEEVGLVGSQHLRRHLLKAGVNLRQMMIINFDCVGWGEVPVVCAAGKAGKARQLFTHLRSSRSDVALGKMPSDHMSFWREGAAAVIFGNPALLGKAYYVAHAHSVRDVHLNPENIAWLTELIVDFLPQVGGGYDKGFM